MSSDHHFDHVFDVHPSLIAGEPAELGSVLLRCLGATATSVSVIDARAPDTPIVWVNAAFEVSTGYWAEQIIGRNARFLHGPDTDQSTVRRIETAMSAQLPSLAKLVVYRPDGTSWVSETHITPIRNRSGTLTHWLGVGVGHDVSGRVGAALPDVRAADDEPLTTRTSSPERVTA